MRYGIPISSRQLVATFEIARRCWYYCAVSFQPSTVAFQYIDAYHIYNLEQKAVSVSIVSAFLCLPQPSHHSQYATVTVLCVRLAVVCALPQDEFLQTCISLHRSYQLQLSATLCDYCNSPSAFESRLKTHLFSQTFNSTLYLVALLYQSCPSSHAAPLHEVTTVWCFTN